MENRDRRQGRDTITSPMNTHTTMIWADRSGRFLLETGYYANVPCNECGGPAELNDGERYLCRNHHRHQAAAPEWVSTERAW